MNKYPLTLILYTSAFLILIAQVYSLYVVLTTFPFSSIPIEPLAFAVGQIVGFFLLFIFLDRLLDSYVD